MNVSGVHLTVLIGNELTAVPKPVSARLSEALKDVEVTHRDDGPSGFQLRYQVGRSGPADLRDYGLLADPLLRPFSRVIIIVRFAVAPQILMDGIITNVQLAPSEQPGGDMLTVTGEDISVMMDLEERDRSFLAMSDYDAVQQIIGDYAQYGLALSSSISTGPEPLTPDSPSERRRNQRTNMTDRAYLNEIAEKYGFVFYLTPGPAPGASQVHWGPPNYASVPQCALSVKMGPFTNVDSISFQFNALSAQRMRYTEDREVNTISAPSLGRHIPLVRNVAEARRTVMLTESSERRAAARARGAVDRSFDNVVTATGELNAIRYQHILNPRGLVGLRGVGVTYDGLYYVKSVSHRISKGHYGQNFTLTREGTGAREPLIPVC